MSPYGLGITSDEFWALTPREAQALTRQWRNSRTHLNAIYANIRACLENGLFNRRAPVSAAEFMPGYVPDPEEKPDNAAVLRAMAAAQRKMTPEERQEMMLSGQIFKERQAALRAARESGATRDELKAIMEGRRG